jgi:hypothetical protein
MDIWLVSSGESISYASEGTPLADKNKILYFTSENKWCFCDEMESLGCQFSINYLRQNTSNRSIGVVPLNNWDSNIINWVNSHGGNKSECYATLLLRVKDALHSARSLSIGSRPLLKGFIWCIIN